MVQGQVFLKVGADNFPKEGEIKTRGGEAEILKRGWQAESGDGCLKKKGWNPLMYYVSILGIIGIHSFILVLEGITGKEIHQ